MNKNKKKNKQSQGRQLLILRHGKSSWDTEETDFDRPLIKRGIEAAQKIGHWLVNEDLLPDLVISSPATRAIATATEVASITGVSEITKDERIYEATVAELLQILPGIPEAYERPLIVGHNPGLEGLLLYLSTVPEYLYKDWKLLTTGTIAVLNMPDNWKQLDEECAQLVDLIRGRTLSKAR